LALNKEDIMREIKFRAWDPEEEKMYFPVSVSMNGYADAPWGKEKYDWILMQFTGLTDKNGKEIYHSDILLYKNVRFRVRWSETRARFYVSAKNIWNKTTDSVIRKSIEWAAQRCEIIGNSYENPELLKRYHNGEQE